MKDLKEKIDDIDKLLNILNELEIDRYNNDYVKDLKKHYPGKIEKQEESLLDYMGKK